MRNAGASGGAVEESMATYTVHVPYGIAGLGRRADRTIVIREGFTLAAFAFGPLYLLARRLWLSALGWILIAAVLAFVAHGLDLPPVSRAALLLLLALLTGLEATALRQSRLSRRGYVLAALLAAPTRDEAERLFFAGESLRDVPARKPSGAAVLRTPVGGPPDVIGSLSPAGDP